MPTARGVLLHMWQRGWMYLRKAGTIILDGTELTIDKSLTIAGPGETNLTISANTSNPSKNSQVFHIYSDSSSYGS